MKTRLNAFHLSIIAFALIASVGCGGGGGGCNNCQTITTHVTVQGMSQLDPNVAVNGNATVPSFQVVQDCSINSSGSGSLGGTTDPQNASFTANNVLIGSACAWSIIRGTSAKCPVGNVGNVFFTLPGGSHPIDCGVQVNTFLVSPNLIDPTNPPASITITGQNMYGGYGMPLVYFYDGNQNVLLQETASSVSADGTSLVAPAGQITFADGFYAAVVYVQQPDGTWQSVGGAGIETQSPPPPPPPPPDPCDPICQIQP